MGQVKDQVGASARRPLRPSWAPRPGRRVPVSHHGATAGLGATCHLQLCCSAPGWCLSWLAWGWPGVFSDLRPQRYFLSFSFLFLSNPNPPPTKPFLSLAATLLPSHLSRCRRSQAPSPKSTGYVPATSAPSLPRHRGSHEAPRSPTHSVLSLQAPLRTMRAGPSRAPRGARMSAQPAFRGPPQTTASS